VLTSLHNVLVQKTFLTKFTSHSAHSQDSE
jgi:hypothetical protein